MAGGWSEMSFKVSETTQILPEYTVSCQVSKKYIQQDSSRRNPFQEPFEGPQRLQPHCNKPTVGSPWICSGAGGKVMLKQEYNVEKLFS